MFVAFIASGDGSFHKLDSITAVREAHARPDARVWIDLEAPDEPELLAPRDSSTSTTRPWAIASTASPGPGSTTSIPISSWSSTASSV